MAKIVIIGAGLTGLSTAYHLEKKGFHDYLIFDKESSPGGLCRSVIQDGFTFDYTGHLLHVGDNYFRSLIDKLVGFDSFNTIHRL
jgi:protoporphyrinogen oxidase